MGKSISIIAITIQIYNVNAYLDDNSDLDEMQLPATLEGLRPFLRPRKTPLLSPSEINKINQQIFSRQLLMDQSPKTSSFGSHSTATTIGHSFNSDASRNSFQNPRFGSRFSQTELANPITNPIEDIFKEAQNMDMEPSTSIDITLFYARFLLQYQRTGTQEPNPDGMLKLRALYKKYRFDDAMKYIINKLIKARNQMPELEGDRLYNFLQRIVFSAEITSPQKPKHVHDENEAVMYSLEAACKDVMRYHYEAGKHVIANYHEYEKFFYREFYDMASDKELLDGQSEAGFIVFDLDLVQIKQFWTGTTCKEFLVYMKSLRDKMSTHPYSTLAENDAVGVKFEFLYKVLSEGYYQDLDEFGKTDTEQEAIKPFIQDIFMKFYEARGDQGDLKAMAVALQKNAALESLVPDNIQPHYTIYPAVA